MYGEEPLWISTCDSVRQLVIRARIWIGCLNVDHGYILGRIFHDFWIINWLWSLGCVVIDILHLDVDLYEWGKGHHTLIGGVDRQPVMGGRLAVQAIWRLYDTWGERRRPWGGVSTITKTAPLRKCQPKWQLWLVEGFGSPLWDLEQVSSALCLSFLS